MKNKYSIFSLIKNALSGHENWQRAWRDPEPKKEYDAIIIGGGGHGLSTAYYLAKKHKMNNIAVVETDDSILICNLNTAQGVKQIVDQLKASEDLQKFL